MRTPEMEVLGLEIIEGDDIRGGEMPFWIPVAVGLTIAVGGALINNWSTFTSSVADGFADGSSGHW